MLTSNYLVNLFPASQDRTSEDLTESAEMNSGLQTRGLSRGRFFSLPLFSLCDHWCPSSPASQQDLPLGVQSAEKCGEKTLILPSKTRHISLYPKHSIFHVLQSGFPGGGPGYWTTKLGKPHRFLYHVLPVGSCSVSSLNFHEETRVGLGVEDC